MSTADRMPSAPDACPMCAGEGSVRSHTTHLGPDDYDYDETCPACYGTGSADMADAINALGYWEHRTDITRIVVERAAVLRIVEARSSYAAAPSAPAPAEVPMPVPDIVSYQIDSTMRKLEVWSHSVSNLEAYAAAREAAERERVRGVLKRALEGFGLTPPGAPGSYARGHYNGCVEMVSLIRAELDGGAR